jgi:hypothetical protein
MEAIKQEEIKNDSVETIVCQKMHTLKPVAMNEDSAKALLLFLMDEVSKDKMDQNIDKIWQAKAIIKRLELQFNRKIDSRVAFLIAAHAGTIGSCVLYAYYIQYLCKLNNIEEFTLDHFGDYFPNGMFSEDSMREVWDSQKVNRTGNGSDNLVDYGFAAKSLEC